ncbi:MAG: hypothetical protein EBZ00_07790 [Actinobacteria bacterium]|nr:hypothetical protein [Actinomycetota bacterium]
MAPQYLNSPRTHRGVRSRLTLLIAVLLVIAGCGGEDFPTGTGRVTKVIDGDTIRVRLGSKTETIRLIGVNTPETKAPNKPVECRDRYGRLLAYVYRVSDGLFINLSLIAEGFGRAMPFDDTPTFHAQFAEAELTARTARLGLWGACPQ